MSQSTTAKTRAEPFATRSTVPTGVGRKSEQRWTVRTEGEERHGVDGPVGHRCSPAMEVVNPLGWDDVESGALTIDAVDRTSDRRPALMAGLMVEVMNPLGWAFTAMV